MLPWNPTKRIRKENYNRNIAKKWEARKENVANTIINGKALRMGTHIDEKGGRHEGRFCSPG